MTETEPQKRRSIMGDLHVEGHKMPIEISDNVVMAAIRADADELSKRMIERGEDPGDVIWFDEAPKDEQDEVMAAMRAAITAAVAEIERERAEMPNLDARLTDSLNGIAKSTRELSENIPVLMALLNEMAGETAGAR